MTARFANGACTNQLRDDSPSPADAPVAACDDVPVGHVCWHSSDEYSGPDVGIELALPGGITLYAGEITRREHEEYGLPGSDGGWWLVRHGPGGWSDRQHIARLLPEHNITELFDELAAAIRATGGAP